VTDAPRRAAAGNGSPERRIEFRIGRLSLRTTPSPTSSFPLVIVHEITGDLPDGRAVPPAEGGHWALVRRLPNQQSLWRRCHPGAREESNSGGANTKDQNHE